MRWAIRSERHCLRCTLACALVAALTAVGCGASFRPGRLRYANEDPIWEVNDTRLIPKPETYEYLPLTANLQAFVRRPILDAWAVHGKPRARNLNNLGEVPDSTWFENRIGLHEMTPDELRRGPLGGEGPDTSAPWTVVGTKVGGSQLGLTIEDVNGARYILKFDPPDAPELETATDVIVSRLLWAAGYHVPGDAVVHFRREDLVLAADATQKSPDGSKLPLTDSDLDALMEKLPPPVPGKGYRGLTSRFLEGAPVGGYLMRGRRPDDPNDRVPHEHRRDVRAQWVFFQWLKHTDMKEDNSLDMWIERAPGRGYLMHYLVDFGKALGAKGYDGRLEHDGWAHHVDYAYGTASVFTLGLWKRPWEGLQPSPLRGVGRFEAEHFRADRFRTSRPYAAYWRVDRFDAYWAAKILMRMSPAHIRAAVDAGQLSDPRAARYLTDTLIARQRIIARYWFDRVNPIDELRLEDDKLCGVDLALRHGFHAQDSTRYLVRAADHAGRRVGAGTLAVYRSEDELCVRLPAPPQRQRGYLMVGLRTFRSGKALPLTVVHLARHESDGALRIVGIHRQ